MLAQPVHISLESINQASGLLASKKDAQNRSVSFTYIGGQIATRTSRGNTTTYCYNEWWDPTEINDAIEGRVAFNSSFNRLGRPRQIEDATGTRNLSYDHAGRVVSASWDSGPLAGKSVTSHFGPLGRDWLEIGGFANSLHTDYGYDSYGRLGAVAQPTASGPSISANYTYLANSDLLRTTTASYGQAAALTTTRSWDYGFRLHSITTSASTATVSAHAYTYDGLDRRQQDLLEDGSTWNYLYNDRNEVTSAVRRWSDSVLVAGQQFGYTERGQT